MNCNVLTRCWEMIFILVLLNEHTEVMDIELGDHSIRNVYDNYVYLQALREYELINYDTVLFLDFNALLYLGSDMFWLIVVTLAIFVDWMLLFNLRFWLIVVILTLIFQRGIIFDPTTTTTIPVHDSNNNNQVPYVQVHSSTTDADTGTYKNNNDTDTYNIDDKLYAHVIYGYLEAAVMKENNYYAFQRIYFTKYSNWCDTANKIIALLVIDDVKYHNQLRYRAPRINLCTGTITVCTNTDFITLSILQLRLVVRFMVIKDVFTIKMFAGKFHYQAIVQLPFKIWTFLYQYCLFFFKSCMQSYSGLLFSTFSYGTVHTYFDINQLSIPTYTTLVINSSLINESEDIQYTDIGNDSDLSTGTSFFSFAIKFAKTANKFNYRVLLQVPFSVWIS